jgi:hypothetical protein
MKKKVWGNATWYLFHTLAEKLKPEFKSELPVLFSYISGICNNLPCPDCQKHASLVMQRANVPLITSSQENLITYLWTFHNSVNKRIGNKEFTREELSIYKRANTRNIISNFINIMNENLRSDKAMLNTFYRKQYVTKFIEYINTNLNKYNN